MATNTTITVSTLANTYSDFDISMLPNPISGDILKKTGINSVVQSVVDLCLTNHYERPFNPDLGGNINALLFSLPTSTTAQLLSEEIRDVINNFEPRVTINECLVSADFNNEGYNVTLNFSIIGIPNPVQVALFLERLR